MSKIVGFPHKPPKLGGPGSFQVRLTDELLKHGYRVVYPEDKVWPDVVVVVAGTSKLAWLYRCIRHGTRVVHRLDGLKWRHKKFSTSLWNRLREDFRNQIMKFIRNNLCDEVVYQSRFVEDWWTDIYGSAKSPSRVIYNGVDLNEFHPRPNVSNGAPLVLCTEARIENDVVTQSVIRYLASRLIPKGVIRGIRLVGEIAEADQKVLASIDGVELHGSVPRQMMPDILREGDVLLNLDINAACPNSVIEALASGLPVVGYKTGALEELVPANAGFLVEYGSDPWQIEKPDLASLESALVTVVADLSVFRVGARSAAEMRYSLPNMADQYIKVLLEEDVVKRRSSV